MTALNLSSASMPDSTDFGSIFDALSLNPETGKAGRKAALILHGLNQTDRDWILKQLPEGERSNLQSHLQALRDMGIPAESIDPGTLPYFTAADTPAPPVQEQPTSMSPAKQHESYAHRLAHADADEIRRLVTLLNQEPAELVAILLCIQDWPWTGLLLTALPSGRRSRIDYLVAENQFSENMTRTALNLSVLRSICAQLDSSRPPARSAIRSQHKKSHAKPARSLATLKRFFSGKSS